MSWRSAEARNLGIDKRLEERVSPPHAALIASGAFLVPLALSVGTIPSRRNPRIFRWYRSLRQPFFKPKDGLIPIVWTGIEAGLGLAGYRLLRSAPSGARDRSLAWLGWNILMIGGWGRIFFKHRQLGVATVAAASMVVSGTQFIREAKRVDPVSARAGIPLVAWVSFATVLTASIWALNRKR